MMKLLGLAALVMLLPAPVALGQESAKSYTLVVSGAV